MIIRNTKQNKKRRWKEFRKWYVKQKDNYVFQEISKCFVGHLVLFATGKDFDDSNLKEVAKYYGLDVSYMVSELPYTWEWDRLVGYNLNGATFEKSLKVVDAIIENGIPK